MIGYIDDDHTSADFCVMRAFDKEPRGIILGDCSLDDLSFYQKYYEKYKTEPMIEQPNAENLIGRQAFLNYFKSNFPTNLDFYRDKADFLIYEAERSSKRRVYNVNLTMSHYSCYYDEIRLILGSPNKLLFIEDLALLDLEELQFAFYKMIQDFKLQAKEDAFDPNTNIQDFIYCYRLVVQETQTNLFDKKCQYTAAVFRKLHKIYNKNVLYTPNNLVKRTYEHMYVFVKVVLTHFVPNLMEFLEIKLMIQKLIN
jgi:hypothetical protein